MNAQTVNAKTRLTAFILAAGLVLSACVVPVPAADSGAAMPEATAQSDESIAEEEMSDEEMTDEMMDGTTFLVRIENLSGDAAIATPFSPGVWVLHGEPGPIFITGEANRGEGLEMQAEDADPADLDAALETAGYTHGIFNVPVGATDPGPARPGNAYEFEVTATTDAPNLSFASMFGQSNDLFIGPNENGIALFDAEGNPVSGDVTEQVYLWDAGSEQNEEPGVGPNQAPRQSAPNTGPADEDTTVRLVSDMYSYPAVTKLVRVTIEPVEAME